ncbi:MAG: hypothetical protein MUE36_06445 [Acidimicrobiales bacterium]|jgi:hypothetical protein|nr:hypothetical protein [Acidimicrobiales bacterium]
MLCRPRGTVVDGHRPDPGPDLAGGAPPCEGGRVPVLATTVDWPVVAAGVVVVTAVALWGLFRRGSIADRARTDYDDTDADDGPA